jgi:hypothetical protein
MTETWALAALWIGLALFAALASIWLRVATALSEIVIGVLAEFVIGGLFGAAALGAGEPWIKFLAGAAAIVLTFLAGAELDPVVFRRTGQWNLSQRDAGADAEDRGPHDRAGRNPGVDPGRYRTASAVARRELQRDRAAGYHPGACGARRSAASGMSPAAIA